MKLFRQKNITVRDDVCIYCGRCMDKAKMMVNKKGYSCIDQEECLNFQNKTIDDEQNGLDIKNITVSDEDFSSTPKDNDNEILDTDSKEFTMPDFIEASFNNLEAENDDMVSTNDNQIANSDKNINDAILNLHDVFRLELDRIEENYKNSTGDIHTRVEERKNMARELKLDKKIIEIYEEIKFYPSWSKKEDWLTHRDFEIENPQAHKKENEETIVFKLKGNQYFLKYFDKGSSIDFDGDYFHHTKLSLFEANSDKKLFEVNISVESDYITELKPFNISSFIPGKWMEDFLEAYEKMNFLKDKKELDRTYDSDEVDSLKKDFGLD